MTVNAHQVDGQQPGMVVLHVGTGVAAGTAIVVGKLAGVTLEASDASGYATCDVRRLQWKFNVRNVKTYNASTGAEETFAAIAQGDYVYIDTDFNLTTSPKDPDGADNEIFGIVTDESLSGTATAYTEPLVDILVGAR